MYSNIVLALAIVLIIFFFGFSLVQIGKSQGRIEIIKNARKSVEEYGATAEAWNDFVDGLEE